jgi:hypothetical protein
LQCAAPAAQGEPCAGGSAEQCASGLLCIGSSDDKQVAGKCETAAQALTQREGETCSLDAGPWCAQGLACVVDSVTPASYTFHAIAVAGGTCGIAVPSECPTGQYCPLDFGDLVLGKLTANCAASGRR